MIYSFVTFKRGLYITSPVEKTQHQMAVKGASLPHCQEHVCKANCIINGSVLRSGQKSLKTLTRGCSVQIPIDYKIRIVLILLHFPFMFRISSQTNNLYPSL